MRLQLAGLVLGAIAVAGCSGGSNTAALAPVQEFQVHIGWNADGTTQYMTTDREVRVKQGDRVRFVITNDDDPNRDYNGATAGKDNFHDLALHKYDYNGDGKPDTLEHEVIAGTTVTTCTGNPHPACAEEDSYFIATTKGTFRLICEVGIGPNGMTRHESLGMWTPFIVE